MIHETEHTNFSGILLFDGICNLCNAAVDWIIEKDPGAKIRVTSIQSALGEEILRQHPEIDKSVDSVIFVDKNGAYCKSKAALRVARTLGKFRPLQWLAKPFPLSFRDIVYDFIGRNRHRWFGTRESCRLPTPEDKKHFLTQEDWLFFKQCYRQKGG